MNYQYILVAFTLVFLLGLSIIWIRPSSAPPAHSQETAVVSKVCQAAPSLAFEDPKDKLIKQQEELIKLYEQRISVLEKQLKEKSP